MLHVHVPGWCIPLETADDQDALDAGQTREGRALDNENRGDRGQPGVLADRADAIVLRGIVAIALRIDPKANREPLASV